MIIWYQRQQRGSCTNTRIETRSQIVVTIMVIMALTVSIKVFTTCPSFGVVHLTLANSNQERGQNYPNILSLFVQQTKSNPVSSAFCNCFTSSLILTFTKARFTEKVWPWKCQINEWNKCQKPEKIMSPPFPLITSDHNSFETLIQCFDCY